MTESLKQKLKKNIEEFQLFFKENDLTENNDFQVSLIVFEFITRCKDLLKSLEKLEKAIGTKVD